MGRFFDGYPCILKLYFAGNGVWEITMYTTFLAIYTILSTWRTSSDTSFKIKLYFRAQLVKELKIRCIEACLSGERQDPNTAVFFF